MRDVLVLGGTGWLSRRVAERWVARGARVTCLARGGRPAPFGAELVVADRDAPDAYAAVAARMWDEVVDVTSTARHAREAVRVLADRAAHLTFVSTVSVYARDDIPGQDEAAPLMPAMPEPEDYPHEKSAAEAAAVAAFTTRALIVRPGLIVGTGDPSDRFGYWVGRFALAGGGPVLVPVARGLGVSVIDVDDLADFVVTAGGAAASGAVNAVSDPTPLDGVLAAARDIAGHTGPVRAADDAWLQAHDVAYWMGPRSLPLWLPAAARGHWTRRNARYRALGGGFRPLRETLAATLADERARGLARPRRAGLSRAAETALLALLPG